MQGQGDELSDFEFDPRHCPNRQACFDESVSSIGTKENHYDPASSGSLRCAGARSKREHPKHLPDELQQCQH